MLPKNDRFQRSDFRTYSPTHTRLHSAHLMLGYSASPEVFKAVVTVSKQVSKLAVQRNKIRRMLYDVLAINRPALRDGIYMVRVKVGAATVTKKQLQMELQELIGRVEKAR